MSTGGRTVPDNTPGQPPRQGTGNSDSDGYAGAGNPVDTGPIKGRPHDAPPPNAPEPGRFPADTDRVAHDPTIWQQLWATQTPTVVGIELFALAAVIGGACWWMTRKPERRNGMATVFARAQAATYD